MIDINKVAEAADMIVNGYAFTRCSKGYRVLNLNRPDCAVVFTQDGSAKFFVKSNGNSVVQNRGILNDREIKKIQEFIKENYQEMYLKWSQYSHEGYFGEDK